MALARMIKVHEDKDVVIINEIRLTNGSALKIKDYRGFTVAEFDDKGNLKMKGSVTKTK